MLILNKIVRIEYWSTQISVHVRMRIRANTSQEKKQRAYKYKWKHKSSTKKQAVSINEKNYSHGQAWVVLNRKKSYTD